MKVLFAVNNDNISDAIIKKYQKEYKEIISYKNVYYFNAILKELQNNKSYDRVVISEDLEPFANNNYDTIDKFLFEKLDRISDEATKASGEDIEIILICSDRRTKSDEMLTKIFGIGIYNALIEDERNIDNLCKLLRQPRTKKEAKLAYKIAGNSVGYQAEDENSVSEAEVQNILVHYKRLGKNEDKYVDSFNNIVSQYTDAQLRIIIRYLPLHVKAVLEERSPKYQQLSTFSFKGGKEQEPYTPRNSKTAKQEEKIKVQMLNEEKKKITKPIVIPSALNNKKTVKLAKKEEEPKVQDIPIVEETTIEEESVETMPKKGRGRPRKNPVSTVEPEQEKPKRGRGRPKKEVIKENDDEDFDIDLFNLDSNEENVNQEPEPQVEEDEMDFDLFNLSEEEETPENDNEELVQEQEEEEEIDLFSMDMKDEDIVEEQENSEESTAEEDEDVIQDDNQEDEETSDDIDLFNMDVQDVLIEENNNVENEDLYNIEQEDNHYIELTEKTRGNLNTLLTQEKKIVSFVGTTKNGTSFVVNNLGLTLSAMDISTAILDVTQSKNAYYIFTNNDEKLRRVAENSVPNLEKGIAEGLKVDRNLTVYTQVPGREKQNINIENVLITLMEKHDVVLIDADFNTPFEYFEKAQEIYLVQSMDVLTIQPLTAFLRNLKSKNILRQEKIKIVINKAERIRYLTDKLLIGGMSSYNDPSMTLMTDLFNKDNVKYCKIPFEVQNYVKYLESLVNCEISLRGYTKQFMQALAELAAMVYPLLGRNKYKSKDKKKNRMEFSNETQNTLDKMRKNY